MSISKEIRQQVRDRANYLCEYCHSSEDASAARFEIDHIKPRSLGGSDNLDNLALACQRCNGYRYNFTEGIDPKSLIFTALFNPRLDKWNDHFIWINDGLKIQGKTSIGRATCDRLDLNDAKHNDSAIVVARRLWIRGGWHPPMSDQIATQRLN